MPQVIGLVTILFVNVSILVSGYFNSISLVSYKIPDLVIYRIPIIIFSLCTLFILSVPCYKSVDVSDIVAQERRLIALNYTGIPVPELGKSNVIIGLDQIPNTANYMFSIAILKTPRKIAIPDVLVKNEGKSKTFFLPLSVRLTNGSNQIGATVPFQYGLDSSLTFSLSPLAPGEIKRIEISLFLLKNKKIIIHIKISNISDWTPIYFFNISCIKWV